jgi:hypothetical protein
VHPDPVVPEAGRRLAPAVHHPVPHIHDLLELFGMPRETNQRREEKWLEKEIDG